MFKKTIKTFINKVLHHPLISTGYDGSLQTELTGSDADEKEDILCHINTEEHDKILSILDVFTDISVADVSCLYVEDIFEEGILIRFLVKSAFNNMPIIDSDVSINDEQPKNFIEAINELRANPASNAIFIPFTLKQYDVYRRLFYLATEAQIRRGVLDDIVVSDGNRRKFEVINTQFITPNVLRIFMKSDKPIPQDEPGYAYRFELSAYKNNFLDMRALPLKLWQGTELKIKKNPYGNQIIHIARKYAYWIGLEILKRRAANRPNKVQSVGVVKKRYYTLRQMKSNTDSFAAEVDIYIHKDSPGSVWATSLKAGDQIYADHHYHETIKNMTVGQPLFICDETSMPSVAAALERWKIETVPIVIQISNDDVERAYFDDVVLPESLQKNLTINHINANKVQNVAQSVIDRIKEQKVAIDCAWGALGSKDYRPIKKYLRDVHGLKGKINRVRAYWAAE